LPYAALGKFGGKITSPAANYASFLAKLADPPNWIILSPALAVYCMRTRYHLNMRTPWGSGPNPDNAFIITLDACASKKAGRFELQDQAVFGVGDYAQGLSRMFMEVEIEFERNISDVLDAEIRQERSSARSRKLEFREKALLAFLNDQRLIADVVKRKMRDAAIAVKPMGRSKYLQAWDSLIGL
jgi:hypothetical protein